MKIAIMQPYLMPYIGYFQLLNAVDKFVIYDDVSFIKQGWINRNNILLNDNPYLFSIPVKSISSNSTIRETIVSDKPYKWDYKLLTTIKYAYSKAPFFAKVYPMVDYLFRKAINQSVSVVATNSIMMVSEYLNIQTNVVNSSIIYKNNYLHGEERVIDICSKEKATQYINPIGGISLYNKQSFQQNSIQLNFLKTDFTIYKQFENKFQPGLSILDVLMFNDPSEIQKQLVNFTLL
ncbi:MAG: WbqC family protein [Chitinophagaceae bacterium]